MATTTEDETSHIRKASPSTISGVSIRGWISLFIIGTGCACVFEIVTAYTCLIIWGGPRSNIGSEVVLKALGDMKELGLIVLGFYFGQQAERFTGKNKAPPPAAPQ